MKRVKKLFIPHPENQYRPRLIQSKALAFYCLALIVIQMGLVFFTPFSSKEVLAATKISVDELIEITNQERKKRGLSTLKENEKLSEAAYNKGLDMFADQYWAHNAPDGTTPWDFILGAGYDYLYAGENLAKDFSTSQGVVNAWMRSPSHRDNILNNNFEEIGIAVITGGFKGSETTICVQMFGSLATQVIQGNRGDLLGNELFYDLSSSSESLAESGGEDLTPPEPPIILKPQDQAFLSESQPKISGVSEAYSAVKIYDQDESLGEVAADHQNAFSFKPKEVLSEGGHVFSATATDKAGNTSDSSAKKTVLIDTLTPFIDQKSIEVEPFWRTGEKAIRVRAVVLAEPEQVIVKLKDYILILELEKENVYRGVLSPSEDFFSEEQVTFLAKDKAGNSTEIKTEIPSFPEKETYSTTNVLGAFTQESKQLLARIQSQSYQEQIRIFYFIFGLGLMGLFVIDSSAIRFKKLERETSHSMAHAALIGLSFLGIVFGNLGIIL